MFDAPGLPPRTFGGTGDGLGYDGLGADGFADDGRGDDGVADGVVGGRVDGWVDGDGAGRPDGEPGGADDDRGAPAFARRPADSGQLTAITAMSATTMITAPVNSAARAAARDRRCPRGRGVDPSESMSDTPDSLGHGAPQHVYGAGERCSVLIRTVPHHDWFARGAGHARLHPVVDMPGQQVQRSVFGPVCHAAGSSRRSRRIAGQVGPSAPSSLGHVESRSSLAINIIC